MSNIKIYKIIGSRRISNYWWASVILLGGLGFFLTGLSSYYKYSLIPQVNNNNLLFLPQGAIMTFYGTIGIIISCFLWYTIILNVGSGYNEFNKNKNLITIFRLGFPGKNRILRLQYFIDEVYSIKVFIKEGLVNNQEIYIKMKDNREIPLTKVGKFLTLNQIENEATFLAKFLGVRLEGIE